MWCAKCSFEHVHPDLADEHFLRAHRHNSQAVDTRDTKSVMSLLRCTSPARRQPGSNKRSWKPAVTPADQDIPSDNEAGVVPRSAKSKGELARKGTKAPHWALQLGEGGSDAMAFAHLESKINTLQQDVQACPCAQHPARICKEGETH